MEDQKQRVYDALNKMNIKYEVVEHEPVHTMEDMDRLGLPAKGTLCKNLFLRDAKGKRHFLVTADEKTWLELALSWGVIPVLCDNYGSTDLLFYKAAQITKKTLGLKKGEKIVITGGLTNGESGNTNLIKVETL